MAINNISISNQEELEFNAQNLINELMRFETNPPSDLNYIKRLFEENQKAIEKLTLTDLSCILISTAKLNLNLPANTKKVMDAIRVLAPTLLKIRVEQHNPQKTADELFSWFPNSLDGLQLAIDQGDLEVFSLLFAKVAGTSKYGTRTIFMGPVAEPNTALDQLIEKLVKYAKNKKDDKAIPIIIYLLFKDNQRNQKYQDAVRTDLITTTKRDCLMEAIQFGNLDLIQEILLHHPPSIEELQILITCAAQKGDLDILKYLLKHTTKNKQSLQWDFPITDLMELGHLSILEFLCDHQEFLKPNAIAQFSFLFTPRTYESITDADTQRKQIESLILKILNRKNPPPSSKRDDRNQAQIIQLFLDILKKPLTSEFFEQAKDLAWQKKDLNILVMLEKHQRSYVHDELHL